MITVFHVNNGIPIKVATVYTDSLDRAVSLTTHYECSWTHNGELFAEPNVEHRSTGIGDILECDGDRYRVLSWGFENVNQAVSTL